jgi:hypothetical protein
MRGDSLNAWLSPVTGHANALGIEPELAQGCLPEAGLLLCIEIAGS